VATEVQETSGDADEEANSTLVLKFKMVNGSEREFRLTRTQVESFTVKLLKEEVFHKEIFVDQMSVRLIFRGKIMLDGQKLSSLNLISGQYIHAIATLNTE